MGEGGSAGVAAGLDAVAELIHRGLRRRRAAAGGAKREEYREDERGGRKKRGASGVRIMTNGSGLVDGEPVR